MNRGDDQTVLPLQQRFGRREPHLFNVVVHLRVFLDIGIGRRHIGLGLVVVVVGNEVLHRVVGEELLELAIELRGQRFVVRHDDGRPLQRLHHIGHGESFSGARNPEQNLRGKARLHAYNQLLDRGGLVTRRRIVRL